MSGWVMDQARFQRMYQRENGEEVNRCSTNDTG